MSTPDSGARGASMVISPGAQTPAVSNDYATIKQQFDKVAENKLGRWVAAATALAVPIVTALCAWFQQKIGIKLDPASLTAFIATMGAGIVISAYKWLSNHGNWERAMLGAYQVYLTGQPANSTQVVVAPAASTPGGSAPPGAAG